MSIYTKSVCSLAHAASMSACGRGMVLGSKRHIFFYVSSQSSAAFIVDEVRLRDLLSDPERRALVKEIYVCKPPLDCEGSVEMTRVRRLIKFEAPSDSSEYQVMYQDSRGWGSVNEKSSTMHLTRCETFYDHLLFNNQ